jgi:hypothetical protein
MHTTTDTPTITVPLECGHDAAVSADHRQCDQIFCPGHDRLVSIDTDYGDWA